MVFEEYAYQITYIELENYTNEESIWLKLANNITKRIDTFSGTY